MTVNELRDKWRKLFGCEAPKMGRTFLRRRLAYKIQVQRYGGLDADNQKMLAEIGDAPKQPKNAAGMVVGTRIERVWQGNTYVVVAREDGFEMNGQHFRSLSGIAAAITGTQWNGKRFFGVK